MQQEQDQPKSISLKSPSQNVLSHKKQEDSRLSRQPSDLKDKQKIILQNGQFNGVQNLSENSSHVQAKGSMENTKLVQSELVSISDQMRMISYPPNLPFQPYQPIFTQGTFMPVNSQPIRYPYPGPFVTPQQQFMPNLIHQNPNFQGRIQDQRSNTQVINHNLQFQSQGTQSQKSLCLKQADMRRPLIDRGNNQHSSSQSPAKIVFNYNQNSYPAQIVKPGSQPPQIINPQQTQPPPTPQPSQQTSLTHEETIVWEQRYFLIIERFEQHYIQFDTITKDYIFLQQTIEKTDNSDDLQHLKEQSKELLNIITQTQQQLTDTVHQNKQILGESTNWKVKYEQLLSNYNQLQQSSTTQPGKLQQLQKKLAESDRQNQFLLISNEELIKKYVNKQEEIAFLNQQIVALQEKLKSTADQTLYELQIKEYISQLGTKVEQIHQLNHTIQSLQTVHQDNPSPPSPHKTTDHKRYLQEIADNQKLIATLRQDNDSLQATITKNIQQHKDYATRTEQRISIYQSQVTKKTSQINNCQNQIEEKLKIIDNLNKMTDMRSSNVLSQNALSSEHEAEIRRLKHQIRVKEDTSETDSKIYSSRIQQLIDKLKMQGNERDACVTTLHEKINLLESDINKKDGTIRNLRDRILELEEEKRIKQLDNKYLKKPTESSMGDSIDIAVLKRQLKERTNEIEQLQAQIAEYKRITNEYEDTLSVKKHEINNLKRQLDGSSNTESQMAKLNQLLNRRNTQIIDLKNRSFQLQKVSNMNELLRQQNLNINQSLKRKHGQLTEFSDKIYLLQKRIRELQANKGTSPTVTHLNDQNELLESAINKKDQEIIKLRQNNQLLQSNIDALQLQLEKHKTKLTSGGKVHQNEKNDLRLKLTVMQGKLQDYQRKITGLEDVKAILQEQVNTLTSQTHAKLQTVQRYQLQLTQERSKAKSFQNQSQSLLVELQELRRKLRQLQRKNESLQKDLQFQTDKKKQLNSSKKHEAINLNNKCLDLQNTIKNKDNKIKELQKIIETLSFKIRNFDNNIEEMEYLKHKITEYEGKINTLNNFSRPFSRFTDMEPTQVFERKIIYQLKMENEALKKQLGINLTKSVKTVNIVDIPEHDNNKPEVKQRLSDFNKKLEEIIGEHLPNISNQLYNQYERDRKLLIQKHNEQTTLLKTKINELQQSQFSRPSEQAVEAGQIKRRKTYGNVENVFTEQLQFYREKNQELQERVKDHIRVNKELKESIDTLMRAHNDQHTLQYYKQQIQKNNQIITSLQNKLKKANEDLKKIQEETEIINSKVVDDDSVQNDAHLTELERKNYQLRLQLEQAERDKANKVQLLEEQERENKKLKAQIDQFKVIKGQLARTFAEKESEYDSEITKLNNKLRITQSEIQLLSSTATKVKGQESTQLKNTKLKVIELTQQNRRGKTKVEELIISQEKYQRQVAKWQNQNKTLLSEIQRLKDINESSLRRNKQNENQLQNLKITMTEYESKLRLKQANNDNFTYKQAQYRQEITRINNQSKLLQIQIDRTLDFTQKKIADKDTEIAKLKNVIIEKNQQIHDFEERVDQLKVLSYRSNDTAQEIFNLKEEVNQLKISLNAKSKQSENRLREIKQLHNSLQTLEDEMKEVKRTGDGRISEINSAYMLLQDQHKQLKKKNEAIIYELNTTITSLQKQILQGKQNNSKNFELNLIISELQQQIRQAEDKLFDSNATIRALQYQYNDLRQITNDRIKELNSTINNLQDQSRNKDNELNKLREMFTQMELQLEELRRNTNERIPNHLSQQQINTLRTRIIVLETQLTELTYNKDTQIIDLNITISNLRQQLQQISCNGNPRFQPTNNIQYFRELLRSILIQVDVLLHEDTVPREYLAKRITQQIEIGLKECTKWNETF